MDLNTSNMLTLVYDVLKDTELTDFTKLYLIENFDKVLSLDLIEDEKDIDSEFDKYILAKIKERDDAKKNKDYALADNIRNELLEKNVRLIDSRDGTTYEVLQVIVFGILFLRFFRVFFDYSCKYHYFVS